jgi:hypothetical protein
MILPNGLRNREHIIRLLDHAKANPEAWSAIRNEPPTMLFSRLRSGIGITLSQLISRIGQELTGINVVPDCILALVLYDCAYMLDSHPGELEILAKFGNDEAYLMLNACRLLHGLELAFQCSVSDND